MSRRVLALLLSCSTAACTGSTPPAAQPTETADPIRVLVFSGAEGFRHASIDAAVKQFERIARGGEIVFTLTDDADDLTLDEHDVLLWNNATGETPLSQAQKDALITSVRTDGKGFVAIHAAADSNYEWPEMGELVGAYFMEHPHASGPARLVVEDRSNPIASALPDPWTADEELYAWRANPRGRVHVLVSLDRSSIPERASYPRLHPLIWCQMAGEGRSFYTNLGHGSQTFRDPVFTQMLLQAIRWTAGRIEADCSTP